MTHLKTPNPALPRRRFIALAGGGVVLAAAPLAGCASDYPNAAIQAWQPANDNTEIRRWMLARVGYGAAAAGPSPRRELDQLIRA